MREWPTSWQRLIWASITMPAAQRSRRGPKAKPVASASSFVYFLLFKSGVKVNAAKRKMPTARAVINMPLSNLENRAISFADSEIEAVIMFNEQYYTNIEIIKLKGIEWKMYVQWIYFIKWNKDRCSLL